MYAWRRIWGSWAKGSEHGQWVGQMLGWENVREIEFEYGDDKEGEPEKWEGIDRDLGKWE